MTAKLRNPFCIQTALKKKALFVLVSLQKTNNSIVRTVIAGKLICYTTLNRGDLTFFWHLVVRTVDRVDRN